MCGRGEAGASLGRHPARHHNEGERFDLVQEREPDPRRMLAWPYPETQRLFMFAIRRLKSLCDLTELFLSLAESGDLGESQEDVV